MKLVTIMAALAAALAAATAGAGGPAGTVVAVQGEATLARAGGGAGARVKAGDDVMPGDVLRTGAGARVKLLLQGEVLLVVDEQASIDIVESLYLPGEGTRRGRVNLLGGRVRTIVEKLFLRQSEFDVYTANGLAGVKGTDMVVAYPEENLTLVSVLEGRVAVRSLDPSAREGREVDAGYSCEIRGKNAPSAPRPMDEGAVREIRNTLWLAHEIGGGPPLGADPLGRDRNLAGSAKRQAAGMVQGALPDPQLDVLDRDFVYPGKLNPSSPPDTTGGRGGPVVPPAPPPAPAPPLNPSAPVSPSRIGTGEFFGAN